MDNWMRIRVLAITLLLAGMVGCSREQVKQAAHEAKQGAKDVAHRVSEAFYADTPEGPEKTDTAARERQRFDEQWRQLQSFRAQQAAQQQAARQAAQQAAQVAAQQAQQQQAAAAAERPLNIAFVQGTKESFKGLDANAINAAPVSVPIHGDVRGPSVLRAQVYLDRMHFSVGSIDGRWGRNSAISVWWWQHWHGLEPTGDVDEATFRSIASAAGNAPPVIVEHVLTADDVQGPFVQIPSDVYEQQALDCLCYQSLREKLSEQFHCTEDLLNLLNPGVRFDDLQAGATIHVPNVRPPLTADQHDIAKVVISVSGNSFNGFDASGNLIFHAPTTLGSTFDPSPDETLKIVKIVDHPYFHYDPTLYYEVPHSNPDAHLKPGPNSPVGVVWMALSKPHYGIHGTKDPDSIGYASSHGCVRLTNWDAAEVRYRVSEGVPVAFVDTPKAEPK
jgi:lipoprotein-anchoring transpeptidase ErfK/SrfK